MKTPKFKYSIASIRNMFNLTELDVNAAIAAGYVMVIGEGDDVNTYYTNSKGLVYFKGVRKNEQKL